MSEPTITQVLGAGASQTATTITIAKADLPGLTPAANNTAESLVVGIALKVQAGLPQSGLETNLDQSLYVEKGFTSFITRGENNDEYRVDQLVLNMIKPDTGTIIDPDDY
ncbi:hypothetical protein [Nodularia chucula]|uniref:hypothetical protein n=1 Tax=Nodularia chucula TaxID=3093667 RepID=UPI0039C66CFE